MASAADPSASVPERLTSPATLVPLLALALVITIGFTAMGSFGTLQEAAKAEMGLDDQTLALVNGVGAALPMVLFSVPIGVLVDRTRRVRLMLWLAGLSTLGTLCTALAPGTVSLTLARMLVGIGATGALTAALSLCADYCAPDARGRAMLLVNLGKALGTALGFAVAGALFGVLSSAGGEAWLPGLLPWRGVHVVLAGLCAVALVAVLPLREPPRREIEAGAGAPFRILIAELWQRRGFLAPLFAGQVAVVMADVAASVWVAPVLSREYGLAPQAFSGWVGALMFGTGVAGAVVGGLSADWGQRQKMRGGLLLGAVVAAALGVPAAAFPLMPGLPLFALALGVLALSGAVTGLVVSVALTVYVPNELRGLCIGLFVALAGLVGFGFAPWLVTWVSALMGGEDMLAEALAAVGTGVGAIAFLAFLLAMRRAPASA